MIRHGCSRLAPLHLLRPMPPLAPFIRISAAAVQLGPHKVSFHGRIDAKTSAPPQIRSARRIASVSPKTKQKPKSP